MPSSTIEGFMLEHYLIATWARDAIVDGSLEPARPSVMALANYDYKTVAPGGWMNGIAQLQAAARLTAQSQTLSAAAAGVAAMGRVCGQCHREHGGPEVYYYKPQEKAPKRERLDTRMFRHAWAVERMWEGLTAPSDNAWQAGADALTQAPAMARKADLPAGVVEALEAVRKLGAEATKADSWQRREKVYGELLVMCAECHRSAPPIEF